MPWMSYHLSTDDAVRNAATLIRAGAQAVKLEGGRARLPVVEAIIRAEIPVMGHLGLTPQSVLAMGGFRVQARASMPPGPARRGQGPRGRRLLRHRASRACPTWWAPPSPRPSTCPPSASGPGRRATARSWSSTTCSAWARAPPPKFVRRTPIWADRHRGRGRLRRRRAQRGLPQRGRELPRLGRARRRTGLRPTSTERAWQPTAAAAGRPSRRLGSASMTRRNRPCP